MATKIAGWGALVALVLVAALAGVGFYFSTVLTTPADPFAEKGYEVSATDDATVTIPWDDYSGYPNLHALVWEGGHARLSEQVSADGAPGGGTVDYEVAEVTRGELDAGLDTALSSWYYDEDPSVRGLDFETVTPRSDVGDLPSWYVPGDSDTWTIVVHGINGDRGEALRILPTLAEAGSPTLVLRYRNDPGVPTEDNLLRLGDTEWRDVEAAMDWARERGAQQFVIYGFSYGGGVVLQTLDRAEDREDIAALVLDAPVLDWEAVFDQQGKIRGLPTTIVPWAAARVTELRLGLDLDDFDWRARADELDVPILLLHGPDDTFVPFEPSRDLAALRPDIVTLEQFDGANHVRSWNSDPERYEQVVASFLADVMAAGTTTG